MNENNVYEKLRLIKPILSSDGIEILGIFGSYSRGDFTSSSDIDILYEIKDIIISKRKLRNSINLKNVLMLELMELSQKALKREGIMDVMK